MPGKPSPKRKPDPAPAAEPQDRRPLAGVYTPELMAKRAVARRPTTPSGHQVKYDLTLFLPHDLAEYLVARAIREGRNVPALVAEILASEMRSAPPL